jgi:hypothetical protein
MREASFVLAFVACLLLHSVESKKAGGGAGVGLASRSGSNNGVDNEGRGGEIDQTTIIVSACFGGLAVVFCGLAFLGTRGGAVLVQVECSGPTVRSSLLTLS